jgi:hypothetical protein
MSKYMDYDPNGRYVPFPQSPHAHETQDSLVESLECVSDCARIIAIPLDLPLMS